MLDRRFLSISLIIQAIANSPAANPIEGTQFIVGANPAEAFAAAAPNSIAVFDGSKWKFIAPKPDGLEVFNAATGAVLKFNGSEWITVVTMYKPVAPVHAVVQSGSTLPASAQTGDAFLNTSDAKLYTATANNTWDSGTLTANDSRYASATDFKIYQSDGAKLTASDILNGDVFLNKEEGVLYVYDATVPALVKLGGSAQGLDVTENHTLTAAEVTAKSFSLSDAVLAGHENNVLLFVSGVAQAAGIDFSVSGSTVSWNGKGLDSLGLIAGDIFIVHYTKGE